MNLFIIGSAAGERLCAGDDGLYPRWMIPDDPPHLATDPGLSDVLEELKAREPIFHRPEFGTKRADFEQMTVEDFWELGASGRRYSRNDVLDVLERRFSPPHENAWKTEDFTLPKT